MDATEQAREIIAYAKANPDELTNGNLEQRIGFAIHHATLKTVIDDIEIVFGGHTGKGSEMREYYTAQLDGKDLHFRAESKEIAFLLALARKYDGTNYQQFVRFACRMLGIKSAWAD